MGITQELISADPSRRMGVVLATMEPGASTAEEPLPHPGEECIFVLEGNLRIQLGDSFIELSKFDSIYFDSSIPHKTTNIGQEKSLHIAVFTPPKF